MKRITPLLLALFCAVLISACDSVDFGDINVDDDAVTEPTTEGLMAGAMNRFFVSAGRDYHTKPLLYVQYQSQNTYTDEQIYNESPAPWTRYYVQTLSNLRTIVELNSAEEVDPVVMEYGAPVNQVGVAELMSALIWKRVTDTWGPVPYTESLGRSETLTIPYTDQETIYKDLIDRVKAARDMLDPNAENPGPIGPTGDVIYGGDVEKWQKFANSFLLSLSMQLSKKYPDDGGYAATEFQAALDHSAGVIEDIADEMWYDHANAPGAENPFSALRPADYNMAEPFVDALKGQAGSTGTIGFSNTEYDSRLDVFVDDPSIGGRPYGYDTYPPAPEEGYSSLSTNIWAPDTPLSYMTAAYTYLNRAEAAARGWTSEDAQTMFTTGVEKSYETVDAHFDDGDATSGDLQDDGSAFAADRWDDADPLQVIAEEKWVALFPMGFQAWSEWRRTEYPELIPAPDAVNSPQAIPRRYLYPSEEAGVNAGNYDDGVQMLDPATDNNTSKFWWDIE